MSLTDHGNWTVECYAISTSGEVSETVSLSFKTDCEGPTFTLVETDPYKGGVDVYYAVNDSNSGLSRIC